MKLQNFVSVCGMVSLLLTSICVVRAAAQTCVQPPEGLISWWPGDGDARDIEDENHGTLQNGATFAPGMVAQAFSFDGIDDHVNVSDAPSLNPSSISIEAWVFVTGNPGGFTMHIVNKDDVASERQFALVVGPD